MLVRPASRLAVRRVLSQPGRPICHPSAPKACAGVMITTDALKYLPQMGLDPSWVVGCAGTKCHNSFALANGFAIEAIVAQKCSIVFFCSAGCYLSEIPSNCLARPWCDSRSLQA